MPPTARIVPQPEPKALAYVQVQLLTTPQAKARARRLLAQYHYLGDLRAVGEPLWDALTDAHGDWLGVRVFCAAARRRLAADPLKPALATVEAKTRPRSRHPPAQLRSLLEPLKTRPGDRARTGSGRPACRQAGGPSVLTAITVPSQHDLGSAMGETKTHEIPVARQRSQQLDLDARKVNLAALHTLAQTARALGLEHGADYLLTVKDNQPTLRKNIERLVEAPPRRSRRRSSATGKTASA